MHADCTCFAHALWHRFHTPLHPKPFAITVVSIAMLCLLCVAALNWLVNPYRQYSSHLLAPLIRDSRSEKVALFEQQSSTTDGLILGSSRTMKFEPSYLHTRTSLRYFNFGVNHGRPEDFLAIVQFYKNSTGHFPRSVLIGVDVASLNDVVPGDARLVAEPKLYSCVRNKIPWTEEYDRLSQLFSYQQFVSSLRSLRNCFVVNASETEKKPMEVYDPDGVIQYLQRQAERLEGKYDFEKAIQQDQKELLSVLGSMTRLSPRRLGYLQEVVSQCEQQGCQVTLFLTVHHPTLRKTLSQKTEFERFEHDAKIALQRIADECQARFVDLSSLDTFDGDPNEFVDGIHPLEPNTRLMIDRLFPKSREAQYAIQ
jgi:hypothetical protein